MLQSLSGSARKVQEALSDAGVELKVVKMAESTRTAVEAAASIGCEVKQIAKSLIFKTADTGEAVLVIASGTNRVDEKKVSALIGHPIKKADADFVFEKTGFAIGGIPPIGHKEKIEFIVIDQDLLALKEIWAAAGSPFAVFCLTPEQLAVLTKGQVSSIA